MVIGPGDVEVARWALDGRGCPDLAAVDGLARLALVARRQGCTIRVRDACTELAELVDLAGLRLEVVGQPEGGEEVRIDEGVVPDDPAS